MLIQLLHGENVISVPEGKKRMAVLRARGAGELRLKCAPGDTGFRILDDQQDNAVIAWDSGGGSTLVLDCASPTFVDIWFE